MAFTQSRRPRKPGLLLVALFWLFAAVSAAEEQRPPNVLLILADDLGYSDLGCYGGEIATPNLDKLASGGVRFTQFYNTARCWPTRAALLTGYYAQQVRRDTVPGVRSGSQGTRPSWAKLVPELLRSRGFRSYHSGKWHIDGDPLQNGFDRSYLLLDEGRYFSPRRHMLDGQALPPVDRDAKFYMTTAIADRAISFLKDHAERHAAAPFFQYVAFTAPHFPLHALTEDIDRYRDKYRGGWDTARAERWRRVQSLGLARGELPAVEHGIGPPYRFPKAFEQLGPGEVEFPAPWSDLTDAQREFQATKMAIHAAMVDRMDREIGRLLDQVRAMKAWDNTLVLFLSDNGASAEIMVRDDGHDPKAAPGSAATHLCLGPGWSSVANTPFRRHKTWNHEGGICTPLVVHWPAGLAARGELRHAVGHVIDVAPTLLELVGGKRLETWNGQTVPTPPGKSLVPAFSKDVAVARDSLWWQHEGNRAIRVGDWKLTAAGAKAKWELYDLKNDRCETRDKASQQPDKVRELAQLWQRQCDEYRALAAKDAPPEKKPKQQKKKPEQK